MKHKETLLLAILIALVNLPLLCGGWAESLIYLPEKVLAGQWWRLLTHPFVHVSGYHLLLDAGAFLLLYDQLAEPRLRRRLLAVLGIEAGVVAAVTASLPAVDAVGYCGLSGLAHGLMALWCLERIGPAHPDKVERRVAAAVGIGLLAKSGYEAVAGDVFFGFLHLGSVGVPVVISHLAGVLSAVAVAAVFRLAAIKPQRPLNPTALHTNASEAFR